MSTTIAGNLKTLLGVAVTANCFVRFNLRGCNGAQARVSGTALIPSGKGTNWFIDIVPDASGVLAGTAYSNDVDIDTTLTPGQHPTWYGVVIYQNGIPGPETPYNLANGTTFNLNSATPISTIPAVSTPTGDGTYMRLDGGNFSMLSTVSFSATPIFACASQALQETLKITLTSNVTSSTLTGAATGEILTFIIIQDGIGSRTFAWPTNVKNAQSIDPTPNAINVQSFIFDGTNAYPIGPMTVN